MAKVKNFKTIFPAVSVPLNEDYSINEPEFRAYLRWIKSFYGKGMDGLVCNGHTGEITGLTRAERKRVVEICAEECGDVMTIISGVNCENTAESIEMAKEAKEFPSRENANDQCFLSPENMTEEVKDYCRRTGQKVPETMGEIATVIYTSLAECYAKTPKEL